MLYWYECEKCKKVIHVDPRGPEHDEVSMELVGKAWVFKCYDCSSPEERERYFHENVHTHP